MMTKFSAIVFVLALSPTSVLAQVETSGTVVKVDKAKNELVVKTDRGEETLLLGKDTKGLDSARERVKVIIKFTEKDGEPKVIEIVPTNIPR